MKRIILAGATTAMMVASVNSYAVETTAENASRYIGQEVTVCGKVAQVATVNGDIFVNLEKRHPYNDFYFYLYGTNAMASGTPSGTVCGTGVVQQHKSKTQIILNSASDLTRQ